MTEIQYLLHVGVDWATTAHQVAILDRDRRVLAERAVAHTGSALGEFVEWLTELAAGQPERVAVAIEVPRGAVVETLLERGFHVFALNPKQLDRFRDRHSMAGAKDDRRDAFVLADSLRTDQPAFRRVRVDDPLIVHLRELSRVEQDLQVELNRVANRLREQLQRFYPQVLALCPAGDEPRIWALLEVAPTPAAAQRLKRATLTAVLARHRIRRVQAAEVLTQLRTPPLHVAPGTVEAASEHIGLLLPRLQLLHAQRRQCARRIEQLLEDLAAAGEPREHRDVAILRSLPGVGRIVAATMLAEASQALAERDYHAVRAHGGIAPVTRQSGKRRLVTMRYGCNQRLRQALYHWGRVSVQRDGPSRRHYDELRRRGHAHARAIRGVVDRLLVVLMAMLTAGTMYDAGKRRPACATA